MLQLFVGIQCLLTFFVSAKLLDNATNIGFVAAIVFGGIPALALLGALYMMLPKTMMFFGTAFWVATGYSLGSSMGAQGATMAALIVVLGGIGFAANFQFASAGLEMQRETAANPPPGNGWKAPGKAEMANSGHDLLALAQANARLLNHQIIPPATYGRIAATLPAHGKVALVDPDQAEGHKQLYDDLARLADFNLLSLEEEAEVRQALGRLTAPGEARRAAQVAANRMTARDRSAAGHATAQADPGPEASRANLVHLVACRALSMDAFARAMLKVDPAFDPRTARIENLPAQWPIPASADMAKDLDRGGFVTLEDLQSALDVLATSDARSMARRSGGRRAA